MCGWSLLFAALHFAAEAGLTLLGEKQGGPQVDRVVWLLCAGTLGVIGVIVALALAQSRTGWLPHWLMSASSLGGAATLAIYVIASFVVNGAHWALAPGVLCVVGAMVALALTHPWGQHLPHWLMLFFVWFGGAILTLHALYGYVTHGLARVGLVSWTQIQQWAGAPVVPIADVVSELIRENMLLWNPWFLLGGILYLAVALSPCSAGSRLLQPERSRCVRVPTARRPSASAMLSSPAPGSSAGQISASHVGATSGAGSRAAGRLCASPPQSAEGRTHRAAFTGYNPHTARGNESEVCRWNDCFPARWLWWLAARVAQVVASLWSSGLWGQPSM
jgi:hypothetical protein